MPRTLSRSLPTLVCAVLGAPVLGAQVAGPLPIETGTWTYASRVDQGVSAHNEADRIITVSETMHEGVPAYRVTLLLPLGETSLVDTLLMRKDDLRPIWRRAVSDTIFEIIYQAQDSMITGSTRMPGRNGPIAARMLPNTFLNYHALRLWFRRLPLAAGFVDTAGMVIPRGDSGQVVPVQVSVVGEERIYAPNGPCDCFVVLLQGQGIGELYWIDKRTRHVVRTRESYGGQGAVLQLDLARFEPK